MTQEDPKRPVSPHTGEPIPDDAPGGQAPARPPAPQAPPGGSAEAAPPAVPTQQELVIRSALETVMDPEIGLSVIDLGLIREVQVQRDHTLVRMLLTTPFCPYAPQLIEEIKQAAMSVVPQTCDVEVLPDPWSPDLMPDPGLLGFSF